MSTFALGEKVTITFHATGLAPSSNSALSIVVKDAHDTAIASTTIPVNSAADGTWTGQYAAPCGKLGFYSVYPTLAGGVTLSSLFTRPAGFLTYAVVPNPAIRKDYGERGSFFGMQGGFSPSVDIVPYLGVRWVLAGYGWGGMEKDHPGQFAQDFAAARAKGQVYPDKFPPTSYAGKPWQTYALPCLNGVPDWASDPAMRGNQPPILPKAENAYQAYCEAAAKAFSLNYPDQKLHLYQVTWEPVYPWGYKGTTPQLVRIYQLAYPALHKADPEATVMGPTGGNIGTDGVDWSEGLFKAGIGKYLDAYSIHPYFSLPPEKEDLIAHITRLKAIIRKYTGRDLALYGTEQGYNPKSTVADELLQAQGLVRENLIMIGEGFRVNFAFYIADWAPDQSYGLYYNLNPAIAFGTDKIGPKPAAPAYAAMTWLVDGHRPTRRIDWLAPHTLGYAFARGGDTVLALWSYGAAPANVAVPVGADRVTVYDWMGNPHAQSAPGGVLHVTLTGDPIYIKGASAKIWGAHSALRAGLRQAEAFPGEHASVMAHFTASDAPIHGTLRLALDSRLGSDPIARPVDIPKGHSAEITLDAPIPANAKVGDYPASLTLVGNGGQALLCDGTLIHVASPVTIAGVSPVSAGGRYGLEVSLGDAEPKALGGTVAVSLDGVPAARTQASFSLPAGGAKTLDLPALGAGISQTSVYQAGIRVRTAAGYEIERTFRVDFLQAPRFASDPPIDANLEPWSNMPAVVLAGSGSVVRRPDLWKGNDDLSAKVRFAWDNNALYLAVDTTDDQFYQANTGFDTWNGDGIQLGIDLDIDKKVVKSGNDLNDAGNRHRYEGFTLALTKAGPQVFRTDSYDPTLFKEDLVSASDLPLAVKRVGDHTVYEAAIPWRTLGKSDPPHSGERVGVALSVNDVDSASQPEPKAVGLFGGINGHEPTDSYGVLTLSDNSISHRVNL